MRVRFITSTPWNVAQGSGTFVGISTLAESLCALGVSVETVTPKFSFPNYTLQRLVFNRLLPLHRLEDCDATVGFDMDGYALSGKGHGLQVAAIKGVIADEMRFESGLTRATMRVQAARERLHVQRADLVITTSQYSRQRILDLYGGSKVPHVVPELIDLTAWSNLLASHPAAPPPNKFIVLCVCRFYPRKRLHVLLKAAAFLGDRVPELEVRIVGNGPQAGRLRVLCRALRLKKLVVWMGDISLEQLARQYNQAHIFCLPSVQEGFGLVFLEAMASGKPIVAARAAAVPEVVKCGLLVEPDNDEALAAAIEQLYRQPALREKLAAEGREFVKTFDAPRVGRLYLDELTGRLGGPLRP